MIINKKSLVRTLALLTGLASSPTVFSYQHQLAISPQSSRTLSGPYSPGLFSPGRLSMQLGGYWGIQGSRQSIKVGNLIGDTYTADYRHSSSVLLGVGYYIDNKTSKLFEISYGINGFYLPKAAAAGTVIQEGYFANLSYGYRITHYPVYALGKSTIHLNSTGQAITLDTGIGPNFMRVYGFREYSLDGGLTIPNNDFKPNTSATLSVTAGISISPDKAFAKSLFACGYRFFYLGKGRFATHSDQLLSSLNTGHVYANAVVCSLSI